MDLSKVKGKAADFLNGFKREFFSVLTQRIKTLTDRFLGRFPEGKRRPILFGFGALAALFFILLIAAVLMHSGSPKESASQGAAAGPVIPSDELFSPAEPDFLPKFLLEREPRFSWSVEDIRPFWKNPANTGLWQGVIKSEVDKLMEGVP